VIDALIQGRIHGQPAQRTSKNGNPFAVCKVRVSTTAEESIFVSVIAFDDAVVTALLAMGHGDAVALAGTIIPKVWTDKEGIGRPALDMTAHQVLTPYHVNRKRRAVAKDVTNKSPNAIASRPCEPDNDLPDEDLKF
jgi:hypothetical protein